MIGTSGFDYCLIRICIFCLHYLIPLCLLYCASVIAVYGFRAVLFRSTLVVESIAVAETLFYLVVYIPYRLFLQRKAVHPPAPTREERAELFALCNQNIPDVEAYLRKWFLNAPLEEIKRENLKEFLLWAFFNRGGDPGDDDEELEEYVVATEKLLGKPIESGRGRAECLRLTLDKLHMMHRSLTWYLCVGFVDLLTHLTFLARGFNFHRSAVSRFFTIFPFRPVAYTSTYKSPAKHLTYWHREHTSTTKLPVVFIHGIGIGLYTYANFLNELKYSVELEPCDPADQLGIIAIEIMPISFRMTYSALDRAEMCNEIDQVLQKHLGSEQKFVLASHSYGTVVTTHLLKSPSIAGRIGPVVLIDPVSIMLHLPDVAYNFTRRQPKKANEYQLHYFASMDPNVSHTLGRHFFWNENILWKKDLAGRKVTVSLGGRDLIVNTEAVGKYLGDGLETGNSRLNGHATGVLIDIGSESDREGSSLRLRGRDGLVSEEESFLIEDWKTRSWAGSGLDILWYPKLDHAQVFDKASSRRRLIHAIHTYCKEG